MLVAFTPIMFAFDEVRRYVIKAMFQQSNLFVINFNSLCKYISFI